MRKLTLILALAGTALVAGLFVPQTADAQGVVRPPLFTKAKRIEIAPFFAYVSNDPWVTGYIPGGAVDYHLTERTALDFTAGYGIYSDKALIQQVIDETGNPPEIISRPTFFVTGNWAWSPIYGKLNLLGEVVLHYDLFVVGGGGAAGVGIEQHTRGGGGTVSDSLSTLFFPVIDFGIGQRFFFNDWLALRIDLRPYVYLEFIDGQVDPNGDVQAAFGLSFLL